MKKFLKALIVALCCAMMLSALGLVACAKQATKPTEGTVTGIVMDKNGTALTDAKVSYIEVKEDGDEETITADLDENGKFELEKVAVGDLTVTITCDGYSKVTKDLTEANFNMDGVADLSNIIMYEGMGIVKGNVVMKGHTSIAVDGVTVTVMEHPEVTTTTDEDGNFVLENVPMLGDGTRSGSSTITFTKEGYVSYEDSVRKAQFGKAKDGVTVELDTITLEERSILTTNLTGFKPYNLRVAALAEDKLVINQKAEFGTLFQNGGAKGNNVAGVETIHSEGYCINADTNNANKYTNIAAWISTKIKVDGNHQFLTVKASRFSFDPVNPLLGLYVIHAKGEGKVVSDSDYEIDDRTYEFEEINANSPEETQVSFDLSKYDGEEIVIVIGTKFGYHCLMKEVSFSATEPAKPVTVTPTGKGSEGLGNLKVDADNWNIGGATDVVTDGFALNNKDPWKGIAIDAENPQPINSYMYKKMDVAANASVIKFGATIDVLANCVETANTDGKIPGIYYAYLKVLAIKTSDGSVVAQSNWFSPWVEMDKNADEADKKSIAPNDANKKDFLTAVNDSNKHVTLTFDLKDAAGEDVIIVIACNVGYRATIITDEIEFVGDIEVTEGKLEVLVPPVSGGEEEGEDQTTTD